MSSPQVSELGQGTFGTVIKALDMRHNPPQEIAIKLLPRGKFVSPSPCLPEHPHYVSAGLCNFPACAGEVHCSAVSVLCSSRLLPEHACAQGVWQTMSHALQVKDYKNYVKREIENQSRLRHPLIIFIQEVCSDAQQRCVAARVQQITNQPPISTDISGSTVPHPHAYNWQRTQERTQELLAQVFLTPTHLAIVMEYAKGGDLFNYTMRHGPHGRLAEPQARWIFQQLIIGLDYCHRRVRFEAVLRVASHLGCWGCMLTACIRPANTCMCAQACCWQSR